MPTDFLFVLMAAIVVPSLYMYSRPPARSSANSPLQSPDRSSLMFIAESNWRTLTDREKQVARGALRGASNKEIAALLGISPQTVNVHLGRVYRKIDVRSRDQLAARLGYADHPPLP